MNMSQDEPSASGAGKRYAIRGGIEGKKRLEVIGRVHWPGTARVLDEAGLRPGLTCLDLGCGGGDVTLELAKRAGDKGSVIGIDMDAVVLTLARESAKAQGLANLEFRQLGIENWNEHSCYDFINCRFFLSHQSHPAALVRRMLQAVRTGGAAVVEDTNISGLFACPECAAVDQYVSWYRQLVAGRGGDADIGPQLYALMLDAGWRDLRVSVSQPVFFSGEGKQCCWLTLRNIKDSLIHDRLARAGEIDLVLGELARFAEDPGSLISSPRIFQVWGRRP
jgi:SAM-dependent methyltransferase